MQETINVEIWNPEKVFCCLSETCDLVVFYFSPTAQNKGMQLKALTNELELSPTNINELLNDAASIAIYSGSAEDVASLVALLGTPPYNELVYFAHYSLGALIDENIPSDMWEKGVKGD